MTFEEIQKTIEGMLAVQRDLQESQIRLTEQSQRQQQTLERQQGILDQLAEQSQRQQRILDQLIGYSINQESGQLDLQEQLLALQRRIERLEDRS
ncbi:MAG TPA: hypothetical protein DCL61_03730 [Cyanobacteria bacterium UBA12227]|nr:hypothetical protein [Cyanobacteria bacterium UBA12227]HAX89990.1 hypothetical protein [Cyanobacteria bacterium UBA11370]HBY77582.1 hypothetical protein [Cyanobacteria bacterium UBA11148]